MTPDELRKLAGAPATEIWIGTVRAALRHAADLADAAHDVRDENERLRADLASVHQAITDSENQPSQYGTVTLAMYEKAEAERDALAKALTFYATQEHFILSDDTMWDTVSGEPPNWWCDEAGTATVEDGSIARLVLAGGQSAADVIAQIEKERSDA